MIDTLTRIYALLVCFVCMVCITISTGLVLYQVVKIIDPTLTMSSYQYRYLASNENYREMARPVVAVTGYRQSTVVDTSEEIAELTDDEVEQRREQGMQDLIEGERSNARASLVSLIIMLLVASPVFYIHWRIAQRNAETSS